MKIRTADKGRNLPDPSNLLFITCTITSETHSEPNPVRGISLLVAAAFLCSCHIDLSTAVPEKENILEYNMTIVCKSRADAIRSAHILTFNADSLGWLDSYQYIDDIGNGEIIIASTSGHKTSHICANLNLSDEDIARISTVDDLEKLRCRLEDVRPDYPPMIGVAEIGADCKMKAEISKMLSEIVLRSVRCDFKGTSYEGEQITDAKIYLTNVSAEETLSNEANKAKRFINIGRLIQDDLEEFSFPGIMAQEIGEDIGSLRLTPEISLLCFPNVSEEEGPGSPFTKLILEGKIEGETYYWPIAVNRKDGGKGIRRNCRYVYDLTIKRKGCLDPEDEIHDDIYMDDEIEIEEEDTVIRFESFPDSYIRGDIGDTLHLWCEFSPSYAPFNIGMEELEEDKSNGIYDYIIDEDGHGVRLILKGPGSGLVYMEVGDPVNEAALWVIEVNLPKDVRDTLQYETSRKMPTAQEYRQIRDDRLHHLLPVRDRSPSPPHG